MKRDIEHPQHRALTVAAVLFLIFAYVTILVGIFGIATVFISYSNPTFQIAGTAGIILGTFILAVVFFALSNVITVLLDMFHHIHDIWRAEGYGARPSEPSAQKAASEASPEQRATG